MKNSLCKIEHVDKFCVYPCLNESSKLPQKHADKRRLVSLCIAACLFSTTSFNVASESLSSVASQPLIKQALSLPFSKVLLARHLNQGHALTIALANLVESINQMRDEVAKAGLKNVERRFDEHQKKSEQAFQDKLMARQMARLKAMEASMEQYAALNNQAYDLGKKTHETLTSIEQNLATPIDARAAFKAGLTLGQAKYNKAALERGIDPHVLFNKTDNTGQDELIKADKALQDAEIKVSLE